MFRRADRSIDPEDRVPDDEVRGDDAIDGVDARLSPAQLAFETDTDEPFIGRLVEIGALDPRQGSFSRSDIHVVRAVRSLASVGLSSDRLEPAFRSGSLDLGFLRSLLPPPAPLTGRTFSEFAASLGERAHLAGTVYEMLGLARPPDDVRMRSDEEAVVREIVELWGDEPDLMKRAARTAGHAIRLIIEGWSRLHFEYFGRLGGGPRATWPAGLQARETDAAARSIALAEMMPRWLTVRQYEEVLLGDLIETVEDQVDPFGGRQVERPGIRAPAIVFVDLSGFTALTEVGGDVAASEAAVRFEEVVTVAATRWGGRVVKLLGDGALLHLREPLAALRATLEIRGALVALPLGPHAGIDCGPVVERDGDVFGRTVNMASRLAATAAEGQILVSLRVANEARAAGLPVRSIGRRELKGLDGPVEVFALEGLGGPSARASRQTEGR